MQKQLSLMQKHLNTDAKTCRIMQKHHVLMQKHAKPPCFVAKTCKSNCLWCKNTLVVMQNHAKTLVLGAENAKAAVFDAKTP